MQPKLTRLWRTANADTSSVQDDLVTSTLFSGDQIVRLDPILRLGPTVQTVEHCYPYLVAGFVDGLDAHP
jgi:hypothetical protein